MQTLDELYISYNKLTQRSIEIIHKYSFQMKKLHIAKYVFYMIIKETSSRARGVSLSVST
jgi:hypothetical protein